MIAMLVSFALPALFIGSGLFAAAVLRRTWWTYGRELAGLRARLDRLDDVQDFTVRIAAIQARDFTPAPRRRIRARGAAAPARWQPGQRAAA